MRERLGAEPVGVPLGHGRLQAVAIGTSTGGPKALERLLPALPPRIGVPILVCLHMPPGFTKLFAERLDHLCALTVKEGEHGEALRPDHVYVAPIGTQMRVRRSETGFALRLDIDFADSLFVPSIDILFSSFADAYGSRGLALLMTGLGSDGALGLLSVRRAGGHTVCERPSSATASSMPQSAIELGAAEEQADLGELAGLIVERVEGM
jgi:two-component system, chemotaxis family, protein-glutamate methylesterase/glutaminase